MDKLTFEHLPQAVLQLQEKLSTIETLVRQQGERKHSIELDEILTIKQASKLINLSLPTIYGLVNKKGIPVAKRGNRLYFSRQELFDWIKLGRKLTSEELSQVAEKHMSNLSRK